MQIPESVARYMKSMSFTQEEGGGKGGRRHPFITISREAGAGARSLAEAVLQEMAETSGDPLLQDWHIFDHELCLKVAEDPRLKNSLRQLLAEEFHDEVHDMIFSGLVGTKGQHSVYAKVFETMRTLAGVGKCIIVGRAGACVTTGMNHGVRVRLVAPRETRLDCWTAKYGCSRAEAEKQIDKNDQARQKLAKTYFKKNIGDPLLYDAVWNTGTVPVFSIARQLVGMVQERAAGLQWKKVAA